jgi:hypothetical protein
VGEATNATGLPTATRKITQRFGDLTFGIASVILETFVNLHDKHDKFHATCHLKPPNIRTL